MVHLKQIYFKCLLILHKNLAMYLIWYKYHGLISFRFQLSTTAALCHECKPTDYDAIISNEILKQQIKNNQTTCMKEAKPITTNFPTLKLITKPTTTDGL